MSQVPPPSGNEPPPDEPPWSAGGVQEPAGQTTGPPAGQPWDPGPAPGYGVPGYQPLNEPGPAAGYGAPAPGYGYGAQTPYPVPMMVQPVAAAPTNGLAVASLVFGILNWFLLPGLAALLAVIFGHVARGQIRRNGGSGNGMAIAGLVLGYIGLGFVVAGAAIAGIVLLLVAAAASASQAG